MTELEKNICQGYDCENIITDKGIYCDGCWQLEQEMEREPEELMTAEPPEMGGECEHPCMTEPDFWICETCGSEIEYNISSCHSCERNDDINIDDEPIEQDREEV